MQPFKEACSQKSYCPIPPPDHPTYDIHKVIATALEEDDANIGDATCLATIPTGRTATATFLAKADGVLAGLAVADAVFAACDPSIQISWTKQDGSRVTTREEFGTVRGDAGAILRAERIALNFMQRMSGVATATRAMVDACTGSPAKILDTRKTVPGLRVLDKWAVLIGGGCNHRMGLYDMIMIKDNHIAAAGGLKAAVEQACAFVRERPERIEIEVETRTLDEVREVIACIDADTEGLVSRVMLDNMAAKDASCEGSVDTSMLVEAVNMMQGKCKTEASGNVTLDTVTQIAKSGCDYVSCGALTHSVTAMDISFNVVLDNV
eukprot:jgi/Ulvmu1/6992/UM033_0050.1